LKIEAEKQGEKGDLMTILTNANQHLAEAEKHGYKQISFINSTLTQIVDIIP